MVCYHTQVTPFRVSLKPGVPMSEQIVYAATRAIISGHLRAGDPFPSVRTLSRDLKINPSTAHRAITQLLSDGLLESTPGIGTVVARLPEPSRAQRAALLEHQIEELVVEAKRLSIDLPDVTSALTEHWKRLSARGKGEKDERKAFSN